MKLGKNGKATATDVPNPDSKDGKWDPLEHMPRFVFHPKEDAFPVSPSFDGDPKLENNGPATPDGKGNYKDGFIGGDQRLSGAYTVTKKGEYTVLTYSFYYAHNKAVHYHANDYSTAQVFLKPGKDGKLKPEFLVTSWHHGSVITPWKDLAKDKDGRPVIAVNLGSHALQPLGKGQKVPTGGLQIGGDGGRCSTEAAPADDPVRCLPDQREGRHVPRSGLEGRQTAAQGAVLGRRGDQPVPPRGLREGPGRVDRHGRASAQEGEGRREEGLGRGHRRGRALTNSRVNNAPVAGS